MDGYCRHNYILAILFALVFSLNAFAADTTLIPIKLQLKWKHQFQFAGYYAAIEKGYFKDVGLKVELIEAREGKIPADEVIKGHTDFGISTSDVVLMRANGNPVVVLATIFQHSAQILLATESSGIKHVHDLAGKKMMIEPHSADLFAYMNDEGIYLDLIENIPHSFDVNMLIEGKIDAMTAYITDEPFVLHENDIDYNIISPSSGGIDFYGDVLITTEKLLQENSQLAENFRQASLKGWEYAMANPAEIVDLIYNNYSKRHSKEHLAFEAKKMKNLVRADIVEIGYSNLGRWQRIIDIYKRTKMLKKDFTLNGLLYTDYLKSERNIPWKLIIIFAIVLIVFVSIAVFFYILSKKLRLEIANSKQIQQSLTNSKRELLVTNKKLTQLSNFKEDMTSMIVHDLKSPLNAIINVKEFDDDDLRLNLVQQSGHKMLNLVENILDVYSYENAKFELDKTKIELNDVLNKAIEEVSSFAYMKTIRVEKNEIAKCILEADEDIIRRVFVNLLANAIKYSPSNSAVTIELIVENDNLVKAKVYSTGRGIPKDMQKLIFEKFGRAKQKNEAGLHSSGLGLAFCKMAVEAHGGTIGVVSETETGVEFWFTLPKGESESAKEGNV